MFDSLIATVVARFRPVVAVVATDLTDIQLNNARSSYEDGVWYVRVEGMPAGHAISITYGIEAMVPVDYRIDNMNQPRADWPILDELTGCTPVYPCSKYGEVA